MLETILNIYLIIEKDFVVSFKAFAYKENGSDEEKINFLKERVKEDYFKAYNFDAPCNDKGEFMPYKKFAKLEKQGRQFELFEEIFQKYEAPAQPLICVTPVLDGKILSA